MLDPVTGERVGQDLQGFGALTPVALAFAPDGTTLAVGLAARGRQKGEYGLVKLFTTRPEPPPGLPPTAPVSDLSFAPDGKHYLVLAGGRVVLKDSTTDKVFWDVPAEAGRFTADGTAVMTMGATVTHRELASGRVLKESPRPKADGWQLVAFSPDGTRYAAHDGFHARVFDTATGFEPVRLRPEPVMPVEALTGPTAKRLAWSADGKRVAALGVLVAEGRLGVAVWDAATGDRVLVADGARVGARDLAFSPDGTALAVAGRGVVQVWADGAKEPRREALLGDLGAVGFLPDGRLVAAGEGQYADGGKGPAETVYHRRLFAHVVDPKQAYGGLSAVDWKTSRDADAPPVTALAVSPDGKTVLIGTGRAPLAGGVTRLTLADPPPAPAPPAAAARVWRERGPLMGSADGPVDSVAFAPDGKSFLVGGNWFVRNDPPAKGGAVQAVAVEWDLARLGKRWLSVLGRPGPGPVGVGYAPDGKRAAATMPGGFRLLDTADGGPKELVDAGLPQPTGLVFNPVVVRDKGQPRYSLALTEGYSTRVVSWVSGGQPLVTGFGQPQDTPNLDYPAQAGLAFSPDGKQMVVVPNRLAPLARGLWFAQVQGSGGGAVTAVLPHGPAPVTAVAWSPDGKHIATGCKKGDVVVWDAATFKELRRSRIGGRGGESDVHALAFTPDGRTLAAAVTYDEGRGVERVVMLDLATGNRVGADLGMARDGTEVAPRVLAFSPDGKSLVVGCTGRGLDGKATGALRVFTTTPEVPAAPAQPADDSQERVLLDLADEAIRSQDFTGAEARLRTQLRLYPAGPESSHGRFLLGTTLLQRPDTKTPAPDADKAREEALGLFKQVLAEVDDRKTANRPAANDEWLRTQANMRVLLAYVLLRKPYHVLVAADPLRREYAGRVEELIVLSMMYHGYRLLNNENGQRTVMPRIGEVFGRLKDQPGAFPSRSGEYSREFWEQWLTTESPPR
jgi:WD40 repeat protein